MLVLVLRAALSVTPRFTGGIDRLGEFINRFSGLSCGGRKPLKRIQSSAALITQLKQGVKRLFEDED